MNTKSSVIKGLMLNDLYNLKRSLKFLLPFFLAYGVISLTTGDFSVTTGLLTTVTVMIPLYTFSYDHANSWPNFVLSLPIRRRELVTARYLLSLFMVGCSTLILLPINLIPAISGISSGEGLLILLFTVAALLLFLSLISVCVYRFGLEHGRFIIMGICFIPFGLVLLFAKFLPAEATTAIRGWFLTRIALGGLSFDNVLLIGSLFFLLFSILCMWLSYRTSVRIMETREF